MKKTISLLAAIILCAGNVFSQDIPEKESDILSMDNFLKLKKSTGPNEFHLPLKYNKLGAGSTQDIKKNIDFFARAGKQSAAKLTSKQELEVTGKIKSDIFSSNMTVIRPDGNSVMPIIKPGDPSVDHKILRKQIKVSMSK